MALKGVPAAPYVEAGPALAAGLAALMKPAGDDRSALRNGVLTRWGTLVQSGALDEARMLLLVNLVQTTLKLRRREVRRAAEMREGEQAMEIEIADEIETTWADKLLQRGREQGIEQGIERGIERGRIGGALAARREDIVRVLQARFGTAPTVVQQRLEEADQPRLDRLFDAALRAATLDGFMTALQES